MSEVGVSDTVSADYAPKVVPRRHPWRLVSVAVVVAVAFAIIRSLAVNRALGLPVVGRYLFASSVLHGVGLTLSLTVVAMFISLVLGTILAVIRLSGNPVLRGVGWLYVWLFRSVPLLVQLIFWYNFAALYRYLVLGVPFGPELFRLQTNSLISPFTAAILGLGLHGAAYAGEIIRGGITSVDVGQTEAAASIGLTSLQTFRFVVLPQAVRVIVPALGNETISTVKWTALVSVITLSDLLYSVEKIYDDNYQVIPLLVVATLWYLFITSVLSAGQYFVERHYSRGYTVPGRGR